MTATEAELVALLYEALEAMNEEVNRQDGRDVFGLSCGNCIAGVPVAHSMGCRIEKAIAKADRESSACSRRDWCVEQRDHRPPCRSTAFTATGEPR